MALKPAPEPASAPAAREVVNDFSITVATINGTGSQTSNLTILRALFRMGIPVSGKNIFPSNIQGLPTWYTIRVNKHGFLARRDEHEIVIAMNPATVHDDMNKVVPGGVFLYADHIRPQGLREDVIAYSMPVNRLARESGAPPRLRDYVANIPPPRTWPKPWSTTCAVIGCGRMASTPLRSSRRRMNWRPSTWPLGPVGPACGP